MREAFIEFAKLGRALTKEDLAKILGVKPEYVRRHSQLGGFIPRIPHLRHIRFDPNVMIEVFCTPQKKQPDRSLTIERHKTSAKPNGGYRTCL